MNFPYSIWYMPTLIYCKKGIVITADSLLFQVEMSEHKSDSLLCGGELATWQSFPHSQPTFFHILAINCVHASNWFTHLQWTWQIDGQNDNYVLTVYNYVCIYIFYRSDRENHYSVTAFLCRSLAKGAHEQSTVQVWQTGGGCSFECFDI